MLPNVKRWHEVCKGWMILCCCYVKIVIDFQQLLKKCCRLCLGVPECDLELLRKKTVVEFLWELYAWTCWKTLTVSVVTILYEPPHTMLYGSIKWKNCWISLVILFTELLIYHCTYSDWVEPGVVFPPNVGAKLQLVTIPSALSSVWLKWRGERPGLRG